MLSDKGEATVANAVQLPPVHLWTRNPLSLLELLVPMTITHYMVVWMAAIQRAVLAVVYQE